MTAVHQICTDQKGSMTILGIGILVVALMIISPVINIQEKTAIKTRLAAEINNTMLAVHAMPQAEARQQANRILQEKFPEKDITTSATLTDVTGGFRLDASATVPKLFEFTQGVFDKDLGTVSESVGAIETPENGSQREIAIAADYSGSMEHKIGQLRTAITTLLDKIATDSSVAGNTRVSIVPFNESVNIGKGRSWVTGGDANGECALTRFPNSNDGGFNSPYDPDPVLVGIEAKKAPNVARVDYYRYRKPSMWLNNQCPHEPLRPLTQDFSALKSYVNRLAPTGTQSSFTFQDTGLLWAMRTLSPDWNGAWGIGNISSDPKTEKNLILFTDGKMYDLGTGNSHGILRAGGLCSYIKDDLGISLYIIAYESGMTDYTLFKNCASDGKYLTPKNSSELTAAMLSPLTPTTTSLTLTGVDTLAGS